MTWHDLLFAHWPVPVQQLQAIVPSALQIDTFDSEAWIGVVPFGMDNVHHRWLPRIPGTYRFPELNVRTYVTVNDQPGVWFFSLDAANRLAVLAARRWFYLPYLNARMSLHCNNDNEVRFRSQRTHRGATPARFVGGYRSAGPQHQTREGSLDHWLTSRYCLYSADRRGRVWRGEIDHEPWPLQAATMEIEENTMLAPLPVTCADCQPLLHFAKKLDVVAWTLEPVTN